jgi:hypothetical protein
MPSIRKPLHLVVFATIVIWLVQRDTNNQFHFTIIREVWHIASHAFRKEDLVFWALTVSVWLGVSAAKCTFHV